MKLIDQMVGVVLGFYGNPDEVDGDKLRDIVEHAVRYAVAAYCDVLKDQAAKMGRLTLRRYCSWCMAEFATEDDQREHAATCEAHPAVQRAKAAEARVAEFEARASAPPPPPADLASVPIPTYLAATNEKLSTLLRSSETEVKRQRARADEAERKVADLERAFDRRASTSIAWHRLAARLHEERGNVEALWKDECTENANLRADLRAADATRHRIAVESEERLKRIGELEGMRDILVAICRAWRHEGPFDELPERARAALEQHDALMARVGELEAEIVSLKMSLDRAASMASETDDRAARAALEVHHRAEDMESRALETVVRHLVEVEYVPAEDLEIVRRTEPGAVVVSVRRRDVQPAEQAEIERLRASVRTYERQATEGRAALEKQRRQLVEQAATIASLQEQMDLMRSEAAEYLRTEIAAPTGRTFYLVWAPSGQRPPSYRHGNEDSARREAQRLARSNPGREFYVLRTTGMAIHRAVLWIDHEIIDEECIPF